MEKKTNEKRKKTKIGIIHFLSNKNDKIIVDKT